MIRFVGFDSDNFFDVLCESNAWLTNRQTQFKEEFRYLDMRYSSTYHTQDKIHFTVVIIYDNITNNEEIDKKSIPAE